MAALTAHFKTAAHKKLLLRLTSQDDTAGDAAEASDAASDAEATNAWEEKAERGIQRAAALSATSGSAWRSFVSQSAAGTATGTGTHLDGDGGGGGGGGHEDGDVSGGADSDSGTGTDARPEAEARGGDEAALGGLMTLMRAADQAERASTGSPAGSSAGEDEDGSNGGCEGTSFSAASSESSSSDWAAEGDAE